MSDNQCDAFMWDSALSCMELRFLLIHVCDSNEDI